MLSANITTNIYPLLVIAAGCSRDDSDLVSKETYPLPAPSMGGNPSLDWQTINSAVMPLQRDGQIKTKDQKIWILFAKNALNAPFIDHKVMDSQIIERMKHTDAFSTYGVFGADGKFHPENDPDKNKAVMLVIITDRARDKQTYIADILAHELQHASDYLSGTAVKIMTELRKILSASNCPKANEAAAATVYYSIILETRALFHELDYFLCHADKLPKDLIAFHVKEAVGKINLNMGYKNYMFSQNAFKVSGSPGRFTGLIDMVFEKTLPIKMFDNFNSRLAPYGMRVDPRAVNTPEQNQKASVFHSSLR